MTVFRSALSIIAFAGVLALTGCAPAGSSASPAALETNGYRTSAIPGTTVFVQDLADGHVLCVYTNGGLSCDWENRTFDAESAE